MGQFKHISTILDQIAEDSNVHPSIREAMRDLSGAENAPAEFGGGHWKRKKGE